MLFFAWCFYCVINLMQWHACCEWNHHTESPCFGVWFPAPAGEAFPPYLKQELVAPEVFDRLIFWLCNSKNRGEEHFTLLRLPVIYANGERRNRKGLFQHVLHLILGVRSLENCIKGKNCSWSELKFRWMNLQITT